MTKSKARSEMSRPELYAMIDELQETIAIVAERIRDGSLVHDTTSDELREVARKMLDYRNADYVPNTLFDRLEAALSPGKE